MDCGDKLALLSSAARNEECVGFVRCVLSLHLGPPFVVALSSATAGNQRGVVFAPGVPI